MNNQEYQKAVYASKLNPTAKFIACTIGNHGSWTEDKTVYPSVNRVAQMTGNSRQTVQEYMDELIEQGWLQKVAPKNRGWELELTVPVAEPTGKLAKNPKRGNKGNLKVGKLPNPHAELPEPQNEVAYTTDEQLPEPQEVVAYGLGSNTFNTQENTKEEHKNLEEQTTPPTAGGSNETPCNNLQEELEDTALLVSNTSAPVTTSEEVPQSLVETKDELDLKMDEYERDAKMYAGYDAEDWQRKRAVAREAYNAGAYVHKACGIAFEAVSV